MYTAEEKKLINYTRKKVKELFIGFPAPAHGIDHVTRVAELARLIAVEEKANVFLSEMSGWLHDIGRTMESGTSLITSHAELSYELCRKWFKEDKVLCGGLTKQQKLVILYSVRYHWNNVADEYPEAWVLRDADKIDTLGLIGIRRAREFSGGNEKQFQMDLRLRYDIFYWLKTKTAKKIVKERQLMEQLDHFYFNYLRKMVKSVEL
jgi:uncharacterized protein